jgi:serine protease AprX
MKRALIIMAAFVIAVMQFAEHRSSAQLGSVASPSAATSGAKVDSAILNHFSLRGGTKPIPVVITYSSMPSSSELNRLRTAGILKGIMLRELPMVIAPMNAAQLATVRKQPGVRSIWANRIMTNFTNASRPFIGVPQMMADREVQRANNQIPACPSPVKESASATLTPVSMRLTRI